MSQGPSAAWRDFWFAPAPLTRLALFRMGVLTLALVDLTSYGPAALADAVAGGEGKTWRPILLFELIGLDPLAPGTLELLLGVGRVALVLGIVGLFTRTSCAVAAVVSILVTGLVYSFGKVHHDKVALAFALGALPFAPVGARLSLDALARRLRRARRGLPTLAAPGTSPFARPPIRLTQVTIAIGYCGAAATKLGISGLEWCNGYTLMGHLSRHDSALARLVTGDLTTCRVLSAATLLVQGTFPLVFLYPRMRWIYLPAAVAFHLGTWAMMDTGPYVTLWFLLIAFLPLEEIPSWLARGLARGGVRAVWCAAAVTLPSALVLWVFSRYLDSWELLLLAGAAAYGVVRGASESPAGGWSSA